MGQAVKLLILFLFCPLLLGCAAKQLPTDNRTPHDIVADYSAKLNAERKARVADRAQRFESLKPLISAYYACNRDASRTIASQEGEPTSLAVGARNICRSEEMTLYKAAYATFKDDPEDPTIAMNLMAKVRQQALENNTGDIVAARAARSPTPPSPRPSSSKSEHRI